MTGDDEGQPRTGTQPGAEAQPGTEAPGGRPRRVTRWTVLRTVLLLVVVYVVVLPQVPGFRQAARDLAEVRVELLAVGFVLVMASIACYSALTRSALGDGQRLVPLGRMFRIQLSTRALANVVPGGAAAGNALAFQLLTRSGVRRTDAGFALGTAAIGSALVLNGLFWMGLVVSVPIRGVNDLYVLGAVAGILVMLLAAVVVVGLVDGNGRSERVVRRVARRLRLDEERSAAGLRSLGDRVELLIADRALLRRVVAWSLGQWLCDMAALWIFIRAFGPALEPDALVVAFGLANISAAIPITPGGLGVVEGVYIATLVGFGLPRRVATLGVAAYRIAQYVFPIAIGGLLYLSLRVGPWRIRRVAPARPSEVTSPGP